MVEEWGRHETAVEPHPAAVRQVRLWLASRLPSSVSPLSLYDAQLVLSELVANSIRHTRSELITVEILVAPSELTVVVRDQGQGLVGRPPAPSPDGGRGLLLVAAMATSWRSGVDGDASAWVRAVLPLFSVPSGQQPGPSGSSSSRPDRRHLTP